MQVVVKALAMLKDASQQSSVVTKRFTVCEDPDPTKTESEDEQVVCRVLYSQWFSSSLLVGSSSQSTAFNIFSTQTQTGNVITH